MSYLLIAEDDEDDRFLATEAFQKSGSSIPLKFVNDGEELIDLLESEVKKANEMPYLILLDLNMPKKDGRQCLLEIKQNSLLRKIPIIVFTTSNLPQDIAKTYDLGVNSYINKPVDFKELINIFSLLSTYWFQTVKLPASN
jgi:CheY-like chemotaxis protein